MLTVLQQIPSFSVIPSHVRINPYTYRITSRSRNTLTLSELQFTSGKRQPYILQQQHNNNNNRQVANLRGALLGDIMTTVVKTGANPYNEQHF